MAKIMIVDDDETIIEALQMALEHMGHIVFSICEPAAAPDEIAKRSPDVVLMDYHMPGVDGISLYRAVNVLLDGDMIPVIFMSGRSKEEWTAAVQNAGFRPESRVQFLQKPFDFSGLEQTVQAAL